MATPLATFTCGQQTSLGNNVSTGEFQLRLDVAKMDSAGGDEVGMFLLASPKMEEAVYIGYDGANVFVNMRNSSQNTTAFQTSFRISNPAPFPKPASGVIQVTPAQSAVACDVRV